MAYNKHAWGNIENFSTTIQGEIYYQLFCYYSTSFRLIASSNFTIVHYFKKITWDIFLLLQEKKKKRLWIEIKKRKPLKTSSYSSQVMSSRAFQDISASLVSFFTWEIKNEAQRASPRAQYYDVSLICSSGLSDIWYDPIFLVFQPSSTRSRIQPKRFYPTLLNHHSRLMVLCIN